MKPLLVSSHKAVYNKLFLQAVNEKQSAHLIGSEVGKFPKYEITLSVYGGLLTERIKVCETQILMWHSLMCLKINSQILQNLHK